MTKRQAARKNEQIQRNRRWLKRAGQSLALVAGIAVIATAGRWLTQPSTLPVGSVHIRGTFVHVDREELRQAVEPFVKAGFLGLDMNGIRRSVEELAWVRQASVRRSWPAALAVSIEEQRAAAVWAPGGLINERGERFVPGEQGLADGELPVLSGPEGSEGKVMARFRGMKGKLAALGASITHLEMDARRAWRMQLNSGLTLRLGRREIDDRLLRFVRTYDGAIAPHLETIEYVDLRYTNGFAVQWKKSA
ncbi:cell division protein FtsQ/DivIB [Thiohalomonas denitrificans]|uniref:Cell division protein FtsQ n=1 Tax=Thiohalomonas denitrificans TaxID=415747 RepID=A0A1G5PLU1_9GAMM|nr:cell division protein FtsQ/DivIB [Thiohalomonas denitrificans]SCZ50413.1 cell division protein FtsQ [Thiohalomonas denitrificans]